MAALNVLSIAPHPITSTGLFRLILDGFFRKHYENRKHISFKLEYMMIKNNINKRANNSEWKSIIFDDSYLLYRPKIHINLKLAVDLFDYKMKFRLAILFTDNISSHFNIFEKNKWFPWSNIVEIAVPSSMTFGSSKYFKLNGFVKFKKPLSFGFAFGTIIKIKHSDNSKTQNIIYTVLDERDEKYNIMYDALSKSISNITAYHWIDVGNRMECDQYLLIGNRANCNTNDLINIHKIMIDILYKHYTLKYMKFADKKSQDCLEMARMISIDVIDCLYILEDKQYKIECPFIEQKDVDKHIEKRLKLRKIKQRKISQHTGVHCDSCLCFLYDYHWGYQCKRDKSVWGHDICLQCAYNMVTKYKQLSHLLHQLLSQYLSIDCIQSITIFVVGNVVE